MEEQEAIRLQVFLSRCGLGSRRKCEELIKQGLIKVNECTVTNMGLKVTSSDSVRFQNRQLKPLTKKYYLLLNKPIGYLCANQDSFDRPLAKDLFKFPETIRIFHVGRLDFNSSGLIFYTNDGGFAQKVAHPTENIEKEYLVEASNPISTQILEQYKKGIVIEKTKFRLHSYQKIAEKACRLVLVEGKNREIRRVFRFFGLNVKKIMRIRIGIVRIEGLKSGKYRDLTKTELAWFQKSTT